MAYESVAVTPGSGKNLAVDTVAGQEIQVVKVDWGGDGASIPATGDASNGLDVDVTRLPALVAGSAVIGSVVPYAAHADFISGVTAAITGTGNTQVIAAQGSGVRIYVTQLLVTNSHTTVGTVVELKDNTTVIYRGYARQDGGGFAITFPAPLRCSANVALNAACITTGSNVYVSASGFKASV